MNFLFFLKRCLAESNRSTRFCRPLPNRSVKTPFVSEATISELRVQRYNFYLVSPNFSATFFKKLSFFVVFLCFWHISHYFSLVIPYHSLFSLFFSLFLASLVFPLFLLTLLPKRATGTFIVLTRLDFPVSPIKIIGDIHHAHRQY